MLCMLHGRVGLSRPFYVNKIYSFIHSRVSVSVTKSERSCDALSLNLAKKY